MSLRRKPRYMAKGPDIGAHSAYRCRICGFSAPNRQQLYRECPKGGFGCEQEHFASTGEMKRYAALELLQTAGKIADLKRQVACPIRACDCGRGPVVAKARIDFQYREQGDRDILEDWHPVTTRLSERNFKHLAAQGTPVLVTGMKGR